MLNTFLVFYTMSGGIVAVGDMPNDIASCEEAANVRNELNLMDVKIGYGEVYVAECEQHTKRPKVTVKTDEREYLENYCKNVWGNTNTCTELPNGDVGIKTYDYDKHGKRIFYTIKKKDILKKWRSTTRDNSSR